MDWHAVDPPTGGTGISFANLTVPDSCCAQSHMTVVGEETIVECHKIYANGCLPRVYYLVNQSAGLLGAGALTICFIQVSILYAKFHYHLHFLLTSNISLLMVLIANVSILELIKLLHF